MRDFLRELLEIYGNDCTTKVIHKDLYRNKISKNACSVSYIVDNLNFRFCDLIFDFEKDCLRIEGYIKFEGDIRKNDIVIICHPNFDEIIKQLKRFRKHNLHFGIIRNITFRKPSRYVN